MKCVAAYSFVLLAAAGGMAAAGPASAPTSRPATRVATTRLATTKLAGEQNPKRVLTLYAVAMSAGDAEGVRSAYYAETPEEKGVVEAYVHLASSVGALRRAATERFGADGFDNVGFGKMFADQIKTLEGTRVFVDGPKALVFTNPDAKPDLRLVRVEAGWKISATSFTYPVWQATRVDAQAKAYEELAGEIAAGQYKLATDARVAGRGKVKEAMRQADERSKAATRPAAAAAEKK